MRAPFPIAARSVLAIGGASVIAGVLGTQALAASHAKVLPKDSFSGRISAATGRFKHDQGGASVYLLVGSGGPQTARSVTIKIRGRPCRHAHRCVTLEGTLRGELDPPVRSLPDSGAVFPLNASGTVSPLGHVSATGTVRGTGFIVGGREVMSLTLASRHGKVTLSAKSGPVPGFTSP